MKIEAQTGPSSTVQVPIEVRNVRTDFDLEIELDSCVLLQGESGEWTTTRDADANSSAQLRSCLPWLSVEPQVITLKAASVAKPVVTVEVPGSTRGSYSAGLILRNRPLPPKPGQLSVVVQFLVPIVVDVLGPSATQRVAAIGTALRHGSPTGRVSPNTFAGLAVRNTGETYTPVSGRLVVLRASGTGWKQVTNVDLPERSILPGSEFTLWAEMPRALPEGEYRIQGTLLSAGRAIGRTESTVVLARPEGGAEAVEDVELTVAPNPVRLQVAPGGQRTVALQLTNTSDRPLSVSLGVEMPPALAGVALGDLRGDQFSCAGWLEALPREVLLAAGEQRNLRITATAPTDLAARPFYFANILVDSTTAAGTNVGHQVVPIYLSLPRTAAHPSAQVVRTTLAREHDSVYAVTSVFGNVGDTYYTPKATAQIASLGDEALLAVELAYDGGVVLPLGKPCFAGELDLGALAQGTYFLEVTMVAEGVKCVDRQKLLVKGTGAGQEVSIVAEAATAP